MCRQYSHSSLKSMFINLKHKKVTQLLIFKWGKKQYLYKEFHTKLHLRDLPTQIYETKAFFILIY